uniref:Uncharacterized protein n=1 Tax=Triticum urartu TaxID=4572 RepID=A0A8R7PQQ2_TRIUA
FLSHTTISPLLSSTSTAPTHPSPGAAYLHFTGDLRHLPPILSTSPHLLCHSGAPRSSRRAPSDPPCPQLSRLHPKPYPQPPPCSITSDLATAPIPSPYLNTRDAEPDERSHRPAARSHQYVQAVPPSDLNKKTEWFMYLAFLDPSAPPSAHPISLGVGASR